MGPVAPKPPFTAATTSAQSSAQQSTEKELTQDEKIRNALSLGLESMTIKPSDSFFRKAHAKMWYDKKFTASDGTEVYVKVSDIAKKIGGRFKADLIEKTDPADLLNQLSGIATTKAPKAVPNAPTTAAASVVTTESTNAAYATAAQPTAAPSTAAPQPIAAATSATEIDNKSASQAKEEVILTPEELQVYYACDTSKFSNHEKTVLKHYVKIFRAYEVENPTIKALPIALATATAIDHFRTGEYTQVSIEFGLSTESKETHHFLASLAEGELHIVQLFPNDPKKTLGEGSFGKVTEVFHATKGAFLALKQMKQLKIDPTDVTADKIVSEQAARDKITTDEIERENKALAILKTAGGGGIQAPYTMNFKVNLIVGNVGPIYQANLLQLITLKTSYFSEISPEHKLHLCSLLAAGFDTMAIAGVVHGDFKPENVLIEVNKKAELFTKIGDWGTARFYDTPLDREYRSSGECSPVYTTRYDQQQLIANSRAYFRAVADNDMDQNTFEAQFLAHAKAQDIYSLGVTFYQIFTGGRLPYKVDKDGYVITKENAPFESESGFDLDTLLKSGCTLEFANMIQHMVHLDPSKRRTFDDISAQFTKNKWWK